MPSWTPALPSFRGLQPQLSSKCKYRKDRENYLAEPNEPTESSEIIINCDVKPLKFGVFTDILKTPS